MTAGGNIAALELESSLTFAHEPWGVRRNHRMQVDAQGCDMSTFCDQSTGLIPRQGKIYILVQINAASHAASVSHIDDAPRHLCCGVMYVHTCVLKY